MTEQIKVDLPKNIELYKDFSEGIGRTYGENIKLLDSQILALSAGSLGLSLTFISDLVDLSSAAYIYLLVFSWIMFGASILTVLVGLRYATRLKTVRETLDTGKQLLGLGNYAETGSNPQAAKKKMDFNEERVDAFNKFSLWMFGVALTALVAFIAINILVK